MQTTNPLIRVPSAGTADALGNPAISPLATPLGAQNIAGVQVNPLVTETQTDALAALLAQQRAQQQILADALEAERLRLSKPDFGNVLGGVQSTELAPAPLVKPGEDDDTDFFGSIGRGLSQYIPQTGETLAGLGGFIASKVGAEDVAKSLMDSAKEYRALAQTQSRAGDRFSEAIKPDGSMAQFLGHSVGNVLGSVLESVAVMAASAAAGGVAGGPLGAGGGAVAGLFGKSLVKKEVREAIEAWTQKEIADRVGNGVALDAAQAAVEAEAKKRINRAAGKVVAPALGLFGAAAARGAGEVVNEAQAAGISLDDLGVGNVAGGGAVYGLMEAFSDKLLLGAFKPRVLGPGEVLPGVVRRVAGKAGTTGIAEGLTEVGQDSTVGLAGSGSLPSGVDALDAFMAGMAGGGTVGGLGGFRGAAPAPQAPVDPLAAPAAAGGAPAVEGETDTAEGEAAAEGAAAAVAAAAAPAAPVYAVPPTGLDALGAVRATEIRRAMDKRLEKLNKVLEKNGAGVTVDAVTLETDPASIAQLIQDRGFGDETKAFADVMEYRSTFDDQIAPAEAEAVVEYAIEPAVASAFRAMNKSQQDAFITAMGWGDMADTVDDVIVRQRRTAPGPLSPETAERVAAAFDAAGVENPTVPRVAGPVTEAESAAAAAAAFASPALPPQTAGRAPVSNAGRVDPLTLERYNNDIVREMRASAAAARNPLTGTSGAATSTYRELAEDARMALVTAAATPSPENVDAALTAARATLAAAKTVEAKAFWTNMVNDLSGDLQGTRSPRETPATPTNPLDRSTPRPKAEAAPAAAVGRQPGPATQAERLAPPAGETTIQRLRREYLERNLAPEVPRPQGTTSAKADNAATTERDAEVDKLYTYEGFRNLTGRAPEVAIARPTGNGTEYVINIPGQPPFTVEDAQAARTALKAQKFSIDDRSTTGFADLPGELRVATKEQKASAPIRAMARGIYAIPGLQLEDKRRLADRFFEMMASGASAFMSRYTGIDQFEAGLRETTGENTRLGRAFRNALQRARSVGTRISSPVFQMRDAIAELLRGVGSNESEFGDYVYALDAIERNAKYVGSKVPGTDLRIDANPAAFDWTGPDGKKYVGTDAANRFIASLSDDKRAAFGRAYAITRQMVQDALSLQLQLGVINETTYHALGGKFPDGSQLDGARKHWAPLLTEGQEGFSTMETPEGRYTRAANPYINLLRETSRMQRAAIMNQPWQELYAWLLKHPDPTFGTLNAQEAKPKDDELVWRRSDVANEKTIWVFFNGERRSITFNDPLMIDFIRNARDTERHALLNAMRTGIQWMAGFRTAWNVAFVLPATAWDALMLGSSVQSAAGGTLSKDEAAAVTQKAFGHLLSSLQTIATADVTRKSNDAYYSVYETNGGGIAFGDRQAYGDVLDRVRASVAGGNSLVSNVKRAATTYSDLLHAPEAMFRFSVFKAYIDQKAGRTFSSAEELRAWGREHRNEFEQALEMSRLITADFSDAGLSAGPRSMYMFFNAAMQGTRSLARLPQSERGRAALQIMLMAGAAAALLGASGEDDEDVDGGSRYARLKGRGRQMQFGEGIAIPLAPEMRMAYTLGNSMALWAMGKISGGKAAGDFGRSVVDTISPLRIPESDMPSDSLLYTFAPSLSHPFLVAILGIDGFGRSTETEEDRTFTYDATGKRVKIENPANYERGRDRDAQFYKDAARKIYDATGADLYPGRMAEVTRTLFGGVYSFFDKMSSDGPAEATFRGFQTEYDEFAVRHEYDKTLEDASQELRRLETNVNPLEASPTRVAALRRLQSAEKSLTKIRVNGYDENAIYKMQRQAEMAGDENQIAAAESLMVQLRAEKARIMGAAVAAVRGQGELQ